MYEKFLRDDITFKILSNYPFKGVEFYEEIEKKNFSDYDMVIVANKNPKNFKDLKIYNKNKELLSWEDIILNYLNFLNTFLREQIGVCVPKNLPRVLDNSLTYLIIQRKDYKDFNDNFFIAQDYEIIFPMITKEFDLNLAILKLAEWGKRANKELVRFS